MWVVFLKISLYRRADERAESSGQDVVELLLTSSITNISSPTASFTFKLASHNEGREAKKESVDRIKDHAAAFAYFLEHLKNESKIKRESIVHVCHRVVHGGDYFEPVIINSESYQHIENLSDLAPLHNGAALSVMKSTIDSLPKASSIAYFDTSFHRSIPLHVARYAINPEVAHKRGRKKYGFRGPSYAYILGAVGHYLQKDTSALNLIVMHLGSGASICAIRNGQSLDTSMGLTPVSGLPGATRSGLVDLSLIFHYRNRAVWITHDQTVDVRVTQAEEILNTESGWKALTGTSDFNEVVKNMQEHLQQQGAMKGRDVVDWQSKATWKLKFDLFRVVDRRLGGRADAIVFSGGIDERSAELREAVVRSSECLRSRLDEAANVKVSQQEGVVVSAGKRTDLDVWRVLVCRIDEQVGNSLWSLVLAMYC
ncbi:Acetokinase family-domain-containing protein [Fomitopsis serialis]|uniref:Acetokinase family-domain-containing protein n=1 Tax=Fomitopsis serialis TaxID=139415 RepID=UPI0020083A66|nr:Acetokinase family-domain-containing protein [Neoantrodia serialis]KAH9910938.1 Acetokinase family-domain-containing protein [Neoantrodia serialis]